MGAALERRTAMFVQEPGGVVVWLGGQSGAVKSALAESLRRELIRMGYLCATLDGAVVEHAIVPPHGDASEGRRDLHETLARLAAMLCDQGQIVIVAATENDAAYRKAARDLATNPRTDAVNPGMSAPNARQDKFVEVHVDASDAPTRARNLRLPGFDIDDRLPGPDVIARSAHDSSAITRIATLVARRAR